MPPYKIFFYGVLSFLVGVFLASHDFGLGIIILPVVAALFGFFLFRVYAKREFLYAGLLSFFILLGAFYYGWYDIRSFPEFMPYNSVVSVEGFITNDPTVSGATQEAYLSIISPFEANVLVKTARFPELSYGTRISLTGVIERAEPQGYRAYLEKEGVYGVMRYPEISTLEGMRGSSVRRALFSIKHTALASFARVFPAEPAAFLGGITLGARSEFSDEFKEAMSISGTTHLVALSGYNISVLEWALLGIFAFFFSRRISYTLLLVFIFGFVMMTGAEASVVRAAIMGTLVLFASGTGRVSDMRNVLLFVALVMVIVNPKVLVFDVGFQLSFLALIGIIYLKGAIISFFHIPRGKGFFSWRDNLFTTTAAQLMVLPVLVSQFGSFSPLSLVANILILELIPVTMGLGFALAGIGAFSHYASLPIGWITHFLLECETGIIRFFGTIAVPLRFDANFFFFVAYYGLVIAFIAFSARIVRRTILSSAN